MDTAIDGNMLRLVRIFDASRERVFAAWAEQEKFVQWTRAKLESKSPAPASRMIANAVSLITRTSRLRCRAEPPRARSPSTDDSRSRPAGMAAARPNAMPVAATSAVANASTR